MCQWYLWNRLEREFIIIKSYHYLLYNWKNNYYFIVKLAARPRLRPFKIHDYWFNIHNWWTTIMKSFKEISTNNSILFTLLYKIFYNSASKIYIFINSHITKTFRINLIYLNKCSNLWTKAILCITTHQRREICKIVFQPAHWINLT